MLDLQRRGEFSPHWLGKPGHVETSALLSPLVVVKHHPNIRRLLNGTELKIGKKAN